MLWHCDELSRPHLNDIDLPIVALRREAIIGIENVTDFQQFVALYEQSQIRVTLVNAWAQKLGGPFAFYVLADRPRTIVPDWYTDKDQ